MEKNIGKLKMFTPKPKVPLVIFVNGKQNEGKTVCLKYFYMLLTGKAYPRGTRLCFMHNGKRIVLCTSGDKWMDMEMNFDYLSNVISSEGNVDVFICAVRSTSSALDAAEQFCHRYFNLQYESKYVLWVRKLNPKNFERNYQKEVTPKPGNTTIVGHTTAKRDAERLLVLIDDFVDVKNLYAIDNV